MKWKRRSAWLFGAGMALLMISLATLAWLFFMEARANPAPNPQSNLFGALFEGAGVSDEDEEGFVKVDWNYWKQVNPDIVAWVNVEGTKIDYPVMRAPRDDPDYYLHHDIYHTYSVYGVPYLDSDPSPNGNEAFNAIVYGHHMDNGTMFSDFASYSEESYAREHAIVCFQTPLGKQRLQVMNVNIVDGDTAEKQLHFASEEAFLSWYQDQRADAQVVVDGETLPQRCIIFCTCSYHRFSNERTLVVCAARIDDRIDAGR